MLIHAPDEAKRSFGYKVEIATGGAAPASSVIAGMERLGFRVTHLYGLTECYGPAMLCAWQDEWSDLPLDGRAAFMARQGVRYPTLEGLRIVDPETMGDVLADGATIGELVLRSNPVMKAYLKNPTASARAFAGGSFRTAELC